MTETRRPFMQSRAAFMAACTLVALLAGGVGGYIAQTLGQRAGTAVTGKAVRDYILENPEILPEAIKRLEARSMAASIDANRRAIEKPFAGSWDGNPNGDVTLVEFFDYACGFCRAIVPDISRLAAADGKLKIVYRELPVLSEEGGGSWQAARVSLLAAQQGKYMAFHRAMYAAGGQSRDKILAAAARAGIDGRAAEAAIADTRYDVEINNNLGLYHAMKGNGTPLFVIGDQVINDGIGFDAMKAAVAKARAEG